MNILYLMQQLKLNAEFWFVPVKIRYKLTFRISGETEFSFRFYRLINLVVLLRF